MYIISCLFDKIYIISSIIPAVSPSLNPKGSSHVSIANHILNLSKTNIKTVVPLKEEQENTPKGTLKKPLLKLIAKTQNF